MQWYFPFLLLLFLQTFILLREPTPVKFMGFTIVVKTTLSEAMAQCCKQQASPASPGNQAYKSGREGACHFGSYSSSQCNSHTCRAQPWKPVPFPSYPRREGGVQDSLLPAPAYLLRSTVAIGCLWRAETSGEVGELQDCKGSRCWRASAFFLYFFLYFFCRPFLPVCKGAADANR